MYLPHDYVCRAQLNGRLLQAMQIEPPRRSIDGQAEHSEFALCRGDCVGDAAVLVFVPGGLPHGQVVAMPLPQYLMYPRMADAYDWTRGEFANHHGYSAVLRDCGADGSAPGRAATAVWRPDQRDDWIVNFEPRTFDALVRGDMDPETVHSAFWNKLFENRGALAPTLKLDAFGQLRR